MRNLTNILVYGRMVFCTALRHSASRAQTIIFIILAIVGAASLLVPTFGMNIDLSGLAALLSNPILYAFLVGSIVLFNLVCAPYWIWKEQETKIAGLESASNFGPKIRVSLKQGLVQLERGLRCCLADIENIGAASARNCQILISERRLSDVFDVRPGDRLTKQIIYQSEWVQGDNVMANTKLYPFFKSNGHWQRSTTPVHIALGNYEVKCIAEDMLPATLPINLRWGDNGLEIMEIIQRVRQNENRKLDSKKPLDSGIL